MLKDIEITQFNKILTPVGKRGDPKLNNIVNRKMIEECFE
jgi:hypothetical protein